MTPDPHPTLPPLPGHPQDDQGRWIYDPTCWMCRELTAQPAPAGTGKAAGS